MDGKSYDHRVIRMETIFGYQEVLITVKEGTREKADVTIKKKDFKARCLLYQCMDLVNFKKIVKAQRTKEVWDITQRK